MTEKELRKLNRYQLLELLIMQSKRADTLQQQLDALKQERNERNLEVLRLGSIAEASLQLSGVFAAAQEAADIYLKSAQDHAADIEEAARQKAAAIIEEAENKAMHMLQQTYNCNQETMKD